MFNLPVCLRFLLFTIIAAYLGDFYRERNYIYITSYRLIFCIPCTLRVSLSFKMFRSLCKQLQISHLMGHVTVSAEHPSSMCLVCTVLLAFCPHQRKLNYTWRSAKLRELCTRNVRWVDPVHARPSNAALTKERHM